MGTLGDFAGPGGYRGGSSDGGPGWIATLVMVAPVALKLMSRGSLVIPKEFERSNLALELKAGKKRLELVLHALTNEQCGMAGAVQSDSISELVSHLIKNEFLALNEACERLAASEEAIQQRRARNSVCCREENGAKPQNVPSKPAGRVRGRTVRHHPLC